MARPMLKVLGTSNTPVILRPAATRSSRGLGQRRHVMRYEQASLLGSPFENGGIVGSREPDVLNAHDVDFGLSTNQSTNEVLVEVLVCTKLSPMPRPGDVPGLVGSR